MVISCRSNREGKTDDVGVFCGLLDRVYVRLCLNHPSESLAFGTFNTLNSCRLDLFFQFGSKSFVIFIYVHSCCNILLFLSFEDSRNILVSFGRQCPPIPSLGSKMLTFHLVFRASRNSEKFRSFA
jgi:hypothetical protein